MLWFFESFFPVVWIAFVLYWRIKAAGTKTTQRLEPAASQILRALTFLIVIVLLSTTRIPPPWLYRQLWPSGIWPFWIGAAVTVIGLLFAVWARQHLGSNWSHAVTVKQGHELITTGPYALVRHPIYTGILTGFLGTAIALSQVRGVIGFVVIFLVLWAKLRTEEEWMRSQFGRRMPPMPIRPPPWCRTFSDRYVTIHPHTPFVEAVEFLSAAARAAEHDPVR